MQACYPSRLTSAFLTSKNLAFPLRNWKFSAVLGCSLLDHDVALPRRRQDQPRAADAQAENRFPQISSAINSLSNELLLNLPAVAAENIFYFLLLIALWGGLVWYVTPSAKRTPLCKLLARVVVGTVHALAHLKAMFALFVACIAFNRDFGICRGFYPAEVIPLGAVVGGFIFGAYWVLSGHSRHAHRRCVRGARHARLQEFSAPEVRARQAAIYPIGVKRLPSTKTFKLGKSDPPEGEPLLKVGPLEPILIGDQPIIISRKARKADKTSPQSATPAKAA